MWELWGRVGVLPRPPVAALAGGGAVLPLGRGGETRCGKVHGYNQVVQSWVEPTIQAR